MFTESLPGNGLHATVFSFVVGHIEHNCKVTLILLVLVSQMTEASLETRPLMRQYNKVADADCSQQLHICL
jgi:hypothetical protein